MSTCAVTLTRAGRAALVAVMSVGSLPVASARAAASKTSCVNKNAAVQLTTPPGLSSGTSASTSPPGQLKLVQCPEVSTVLLMRVLPKLLRVMSASTKASAAQQQQQNTQRLKRPAHACGRNENSCWCLFSAASNLVACCHAKTQLYGQAQQRPVLCWQRTCLRA